MSDCVSNEFVALYFRNPSDAVAALARLATELELASPYRVRERWLSPRGRVALLNLTLRSAPEAVSQQPRWANPLRTSTLRAVAQAGYATTPSREWDASLRRRGQRLSCKDAGGIAAFAAAFCEPDAEEALFLWSTRPGLRSLAWAETPALFVAGTRPALVHRIARDFQAAELDRQYVLDSLAGWSLGERTPYVGTSLLPVDGLLCFSAGAASFHAHPTPAYDGRARLHWGTSAAAYQSALRSAVEPLRGLSGFELRLSGGKDSRLVAAALSAAGITPTTTVCHGVEGEWETPAAARVAQALGWPLRYVVPEFAPGGIHARVRANLSAADGLFATEPLQVAYPPYGMLGDAGPGIVLGHIELQRGGWAEKMRISRQGVLTKLRNSVAPYRTCAGPAVIDPVLAAGRAFVEGLPAAMREAERLYWVNHRYRVSRWLLPHYLVHARELLPVYPLLDEKVVRLVAEMPLAWLVSEKLAFDATTALAPTLRSLPLFKERYRFEEARPSLRRLFGYRARQPLQPGPSTHLKRELVMPGDIRPTLCEHIRAGKLKDELREVTLPAVWAMIEDPTRARADAAGAKPKPLASYLWTCYQASVLFTDGPLF